MNENTTTLELKEPIVDEHEDDTEGLESIAMIQEMLQDMIKINVDSSEVEGTKIDKKEFEKGVKAFSKLAGAFSVLKNSGMSEEAIVTYLLNERNIEHSQAMQKIINDGQLEIAKTGAKMQTLTEEEHSI